MSHAGVELGSDGELKAEYNPHQISVKRSEHLFAEDSTFRDGWTF